MEQFDFHPQEKEFVVGANRNYIGHLPAHLAQADRTKDVTRIVMFHLEERNDATLQFKGGDRQATPYSGKALKNPNTGAKYGLHDWKTVGSWTYRDVVGTVMGRGYFDLEMLVATPTEPIPTTTTIGEVADDKTATKTK